MQFIIKNKLLIVLLAAATSTAGILGVGSFSNRPKIYPITPWSIAVDKNGNLYVVSVGHLLTDKTGQASAKIYKFNEQGRLVKRWGSRKLGLLEDISVDSTGNIYATNEEKIIKFSSEGSVTAQWQAKDIGFRVWSISALAVDRSGNIFATDHNRDGNSREVFNILKLDKNGSLLNMWSHSRGTGNNQFLSIADIAIGKGGRIYVSDSDADNVKVYNSSGKLVARWGSAYTDDTRVDGDGEFNHPNGIAVAPKGNVYVADSRNHRIQKFSTRGKFLTKWGSLGKGSGEFGGWSDESNPTDVAVDPRNGDVYAIDLMNQRVQKFTPNGKFLSEIKGQN